MAFKAIDQVFDSSLKLPGPDGVIWVIPEGPAEVGLWCARIIGVAKHVADGGEVPEDAPPLLYEGAEELGLQVRLLGQQMVDTITDNHGKATLDFVTQTVVIWHALGRDAAEAFWNAGGDPKASQPTLKRGARQTRAVLTNTGAAPTTKRAGSTSGMTSRKAK